MNPLLPSATRPNHYFRLRLAYRCIYFLMPLLAYLPVSEAAVMPGEVPESRPLARLLLLPCLMPSGAQVLSRAPSAARSPDFMGSPKLTGLIPRLV